ncbi:D-alanyl-D-alanine carboxypeptidase family protein [Paenibacillus chitinolyticus]|uniref:D-alanyl-D-alanine carboxypeptidase family protein n=1 Tax=Paenibacillus chitinolyticus TaxID=79263 RepID=UPI001C44B643|nr:D-alanyl-D-alanine carboxypeptidase [Paenibacillus chitinolyticus]MBV6714426.1 D-alanyl-D-alanine carboxypeptidase [Paenibacillus chitinolyticus]
MKLKSTLLGLTAAVIALTLVSDPLHVIKPHAAAAISTLRSGLLGESGSPLTSSVEGEAAVLMDADTGKVLFEKQKDSRLYPASTTKIVSAMVALEKGGAKDRITVGDEIRLKTTGESTAGLWEGQRLSLEDLIAAMMLPSGNDAARTVARYIAEKDSGRKLSAEEGIAYFAGLMNEKAAAVGAKRSHFTNPHGLHDPKHYTTAGDMALLAREAMKNKVFRSIVDQPRHTVASAGHSQTFVNRNQLLQEGGAYYFKGVNGVKTGFTDEAGYCLVSSADLDGKNLITVVLRSSSGGVYTDTHALLKLAVNKEGA